VGRVEYGMLSTLREGRETAISGPATFYILGGAPPRREICS